MCSSIQHLYRQSPDGDGLFYAWFPSMHTRIDIMLSCRNSEDELLLVIGAIQDTLQQLEKIANYYDPASELALVNKVASLRPVKLSRTLYEMIFLCLEYHKKTLGCFDVTIHSEHYTRDTIQSVQLSAEDRSVFFWQEGVTINLSGFLKGYALEQIRKILEKYLIKNALINMGNSSVFALGNHPNGKGWKVDFGKRVNTETYGKDNALLLFDECLTTSGNDSAERKHLISPQSGKLIEGFRQLAIVTANGAIGEILSTSLFVANEEQRALLIDRFRLKTVIEL
ncbi:FAD:protein FMN transferase [Bacteroides sp.]|uniref:FAD:protein FMN transferase n=1 Tax=Bacteroides sp. TaxID=29523 RepID=UPI00262B0CEE|nr:FAD:protein FMN transferase [Bacteroides sp.]MDD3038279.1 FAD:protein FMN transferase [Bacteroides sp.]